MNLQQILEIEPRLIDVIAWAKRVRRANWNHYESGKARLQRLAGWYAQRPELRSTTAYDVALKALINALRI